MKNKLGVIGAVVAACSLPGVPVQAQPVADFKTAVTQAVMTNPRVNAAWYNFEATREAQRAAKGGYFPSVDLSAEIGREERETPLVDLGDYTRDATRFTITQMLFDGFATREEVRALGFNKLNQYYELQRASEEIALEAARAYLDTVRYQQLVKFAEENYVFHRDVYGKISERTDGGVSQGVDQDQASARVALAESNLLTEMTNLHDVQARFQRIVGDLPAANLQMPVIPSGMIPEMRAAALNLAYEKSPEINAAIENLRAAQADLNRTNAPFMPQVDLRYRNEVEHDTDGLEGRYDEEAVELVLNYNLFRGGADSARKREFYNRYYSAMEERKQACLNVRQNTMIAFNDILALAQQVVYLDRNRLAQDKTRRAYQDQFDIGQRTLLDLLDSQNEYFDTQRAYVSAEANLRAAQTRTLANIGLLRAAMDVDGLNEAQIAQYNLELSRGDDPNGEPLCPPEAPRAVEVDKEALMERLSTTGANTSRYRDVGENRVAVSLNVQFAINSSVITSDFDEEIGRAAVFLKDNPAVVAIVEGHADITGEPEYNQWLSDRRANAVRKLLIDKHGVRESQITAVGYGQTRPIADNNTAEGRSLNRRVDLVLDSNGV
ncbi:TolC family outer membrane protein [Haliea sp. E1-2-M8]|uniref:TolC family outer membrane protein n=1 Tax=Haliea sp. E1-2-M8 TaxID=3064706 RepID=UPI0027242967|nr:TolC family outer membrane protein [Haliea sp. E1-2-M8]MDO8860512.1 TolC family outer membrane protein [Haliea sp. E1-2-M8]